MNTCFKLKIFSESLKKFGKAKNKEAVIMGIDKSSEYIAADSLDRPSNLEPVIVTPALLAPGINAKHWHIPIMKASLKLSFSHVFFDYHFFMFCC